MISSCRQCIINAQRGANSQKQPLAAIFAHGDTTYYVKITQAINGFDLSDNTRWIYWDIDLLTANLSFGFTLIEPSVGKVFPSTPDIDKHFFNTVLNKMYIWSGTEWVERIRLFANKIENNKVISTAISSNINEFESFKCGEIIFDRNNKPIRRFNNDGTFKFITTETFNNSQHVNLSNFVFEKIQHDATAEENLNKFTCVRWGTANKLVNASNTDYFPAFAMVERDYETDDIVKIITHGFVINKDWQWVEPANTSLFVGTDGQITTTVPQNYSLQKIGYIVSPQKIYLNFENQIIFNPVEVSVTPSSTPAVTPTISVTPTLTPTNTVTSTPMLTPTQTVTPTRTPTPSVTPSTS